MRQRKRKKRRILVVDNVLVNDRHDVATRTLQLAVCVFVSGCVHVCMGEIGRGGGGGNS